MCVCVCGGGGGAEETFLSLYFSEKLVEGGLKKNHEESIEESSQCLAHCVTLTRLI